MYFIKFIIQSFSFHVSVEGGVPNEHHLYIGSSAGHKHVGVQLLPPRRIPGLGFYQ